MQVYLWFSGCGNDFARCEEKCRFSRMARVVIVMAGRLAETVRFDDGQLAGAIAFLEARAEAAGVHDTVVFWSEPARALRPG